MSRRRRKQPRALLASGEVIARAEKKLRQADFFARHLDNMKQSSLPEHAEFYLSASMTAARSAFYIVRDHGGRVFSRAQRAWRRGQPPADMTFHQCMIDLRDDDVHHGTVEATSLTKLVDAQMSSSIRTLGFPVEVMAEATNPDGTVVRALALTGVPGLYIDHDGKRIDAVTACRQFTVMLRGLIAEFKRSAAGTTP
jgi:hypothetical protein